MKKKCIFATNKSSKTGGGALLVYFLNYLTNSKSNNGTGI